MKLKVNRFIFQYPTEADELHYITDKELNEVMEEIEQEQAGIKDDYPLKNIRKIALNT